VSAFLLAALGLRLLLLGSKSLWLDEALSLPQAQHWLDAHGTLLDTIDFYRIHV